MFSCLLKRVLPFTLTFILGAAVGGLFRANRAETAAWTWEKAAPLLGHEGPFGYGHSCRMRARNLVAETKPLLIRFKPDARWPRVSEGYTNSVWVRVTFGADGKVQDVKQLQTLMPDAVQQAVERAARQIQFEPETINSVPVSVTKEVEIHFMAD
jgi:TonB family protein